MCGLFLATILDVKISMLPVGTCRVDNMSSGHALHRSAVESKTEGLARPNRRGSGHSEVCGIC